MDVAHLLLVNLCHALQAYTAQVGQRWRVGVPCRDIDFRVRVHNLAGRRTFLAITCHVLPWAHGQGGESYWGCLAGALSPEPCRGIGNHLSSCGGLRVGPV